MLGTDQWGGGCGPPTWSTADLKPRLPWRAELQQFAENCSDYRKNNIESAARRDPGAAPTGRSTLLELGRRCFTFLNYKLDAISWWRTKHLKNWPCPRPWRLRWQQGGFAPTAVWQSSSFGAPEKNVSKLPVHEVRDLQERPGPAFHPRAAAARGGNAPGMDGLLVVGWLVWPVHRARRRVVHPTRGPQSPFNARQSRNCPPERPPKQLHTHKENAPFWRESGPRPPPGNKHAKNCGWSSRGLVDFFNKIPSGTEEAVDGQGIQTGPPPAAKNGNPRSFYFLQVAAFSRNPFRLPD